MNCWYIDFRYMMIRYIDTHKNVCCYASYFVYLILFELWLIWDTPTLIWRNCNQRADVSERKIWHRDGQQVLLLVEDKGLPILSSQRYGCLCSGDATSQGISGHINRILGGNSGFSTIRVNITRCGVAWDITNTKTLFLVSSLTPCCYWST